MRVRCPHCGKRFDPDTDDDEEALFDADELGDDPETDEDDDYAAT